MLALEGLTGLVVIDEVQRRPDLFPALRVLADRPGVTCRFLVLGSASPLLRRCCGSPRSRWPGASPSCRVGPLEALDRVGGLDRRAGVVTDVVHLLRAQGARRDASSGITSNLGVSI